MPSSGLNHEPREKCMLATVKTGTLSRQQFVTSATFDDCECMEFMRRVDGFDNDDAIRSAEMSVCGNDEVPR